MDAAPSPAIGIPRNEGPTPLFGAYGIVKRFGSFTANDGVDLEIRAGEIHALLGENGAGKSTLMKMLYGLLEPTEGVITHKGDIVQLPNPEAARRLGIGMVFQHFSLCENLTVAENIALVMPKALSGKALAARIARLGADYGLHLDPSRPVWSLSAGERQRIEIVRCLLQDPSLLILDEPTSVLTPGEAEVLFTVLERLREEGRALLYISHRLDEVRRLCARATILRAGKVVGACNPREETARSLAAMMVGTAVREVTHRKRGTPGRERLRVDRLSLPAPGLHATSLRDVTLSVAGGEILGIAGIAGNGQAELFAALSGEIRAPSPEAVRIDGQPVGSLGINARRRLGAGFVPEERNGHAAAPLMSLSENVLLSRYATVPLTRFGCLKLGSARDLARRVIDAFDVRKAGPDPAAGTLSGGNLQKFVVGREILAEPGVLVINQPSWGVDAAAAAHIRQAVIDLAARGAAILVISQDLVELFEMAGKLSVLNDGTLSPAVPSAETSREAVGLLMGGASDHGSAGGSLPPVHEMAPVPLPAHAH
ncbi:ABC transporter ATP-binding protein [Methylobacterium gnaphalii]|uniref:ABC transporter ATP-binding protein n=1 Tax=Methylobacterium gnaphalii TaxID=1010610 RepID=A0A512JME4_9HYPH|nr:ABC transporter ATP-binding protein [Methylobacterium gnaphalii]GEP11146.1 ABC transporter ATP-binding protein [Methylobacterium gnaphalii]GJD71155.1 Galactose/methyl galactoside import ATP-binding protein MglA [Methylobacterium gnaphalii]GLS49651.1 ABC transporter ATP-binding protein [Methylobacterium gnaphalii]